MKLQDDPFNKIKSGTKTIELRLYDEKRSLVKVGDIINFTNKITGEVISVEVKNLYRYDSFKDLYEDFDNVSLGYKEKEKKNPNDMLKYYSLEEQEHYGVIGIGIKKI